MASTTSNLGLTKPAYTDDADIGDLNGNFDLIDAEAGRVRANFAGTYSTSSAYAVGAYVIYQGNLYKCTTAIGSGGEAWNSAHWDQVSVGTELGTLNSNLTQLSDQIVTLNSNLNNLALHRKSIVVSSDVYVAGMYNLIPNTVYAYFGTSADNTYYWAISTTDGNGQLSCGNSNKWKAGSTIIAIG